LAQHHQHRQQQEIYDEIARLDASLSAGESLVITTSTSPIDGSTTIVVHIQTNVLEEEYVDVDEEEQHEQPSHQIDQASHEERRRRTKEESRTVAGLKAQVTRLKRRLRSCRDENGNIAPPSSDDNDGNRDRKRKRSWPELVGKDAQYAKETIEAETDGRVTVVSIVGKNKRVTSDFVGNRVRLFVDRPTNKVLYVPKRG